VSGLTRVLCWLRRVMTSLAGAAAVWHVFLLRAVCTCMHCGTCSVALCGCRMHCGQAQGITCLV
jgi:hypothetical protein